MTTPVSNDEPNTDAPEPEEEPSSAPGAAPPPPPEEPSKGPDAEGPPPPSSEPSPEDVEKLHKMDEILRDTGATKS